MIKEIHKYFLSCPLIKDNETLSVNILPKEAVSYAINEIPSMNGGVIKSYVNGTEIKEINFSFSCRFEYSELNATMFKNSDFYQELFKWVENNNRNGVLPDIENCRMIEVIQTPYIFMVDPSFTKADYQATFKLTYKKERE